MNSHQSGSQWSKWDLHVHTPESLVNEYGGDWDRFLTEIESLPPEFKVIGINDYLFLDGYKRIIAEKASGRLQNIELFLPVVEFRIKKFAGVEFGLAERINLHVIFSNELDPATIEAQFLSALQAAYSLEPGVTESTWSGVITRQSLKDFGAAIKKSIPPERLPKYGSDEAEGFRNLNIDEAKVFNILRKSSYFKGKYLTAVGKSEWDQIKWSDHSIAEKKDILNKVDLIFTSAETVGNAVKAKTKLKDQNLNSNLLDCSDAHRFSGDSYKDRLGKCFTWIKAAPTFEGLRQVIFEPDARVRIQESNPQYDYPKHFFSSLEIEGKPFAGESLEFSKTRIPLNRDLITIIGGRGTGKSMLLDTLYLTFNKSDSDPRLTAFQMVPFSARLRKGAAEEEEVFSLSDEAEQFEYLHVRQGHVKTLVDRSTDLHKEVLRLLGPGTFRRDPLFEEELSNRNEQIAQIRQFLSRRDETGQRVNSVEYHQRNIRQNESLLKTVTTEETKQQIGEFTENSKQLTTLDKLVDDLKRLRSELTEFDRSANESISGINERLPNRVDLHITGVDLSKQLLQIEELSKFSGTTRSDLIERNNKIETKLAGKGFKGDIANLLSKADSYQRAIQQSVESTDDINANEVRLAELGQARRDSVARIKQYLEEERDDIGARFKHKQAGADQLSGDHKALLQSLLKDIDIRGIIAFDQKQFLEGIWKFIDGRKFRSTTTKAKELRLAETLGVSTADEFFGLIEGKQVIRLDSDTTPIDLEEFVQTPDLFYEGNEREFYDYLFLPVQRGRYLHVEPTVQYQGKELRRLSVGQRGTFYLCLKLATESFSTPFVFDQPEDDLDNEFIIDHLLPVFREIKKYRQVIIATHNANLVVNADSEQIIIATNKDEVLTYQFGALENPDIRTRICDILEGGEKAFLKRERRYGIGGAR